MVSWEIFDETCLPFKSKFYSNLTLDNVTYLL